MLGATLMLNGACVNKLKTNKKPEPITQSISEEKPNSSQIEDLKQVVYKNEKCEFLNRIDNSINTLEKQIDPTTLFSKEKNKYIEWKIKKIESNIELYLKNNNLDSRLKSSKSRLNDLTQLWKKEKGEKYYKINIFFAKKSNKQKESLETMLLRWEELEYVIEAQPDIAKYFIYDNLVSEIVSRIVTELESKNNKAFIKKNSSRVNYFIKKNKEEIKSKIQNEVNTLKKTYKRKRISSIFANGAVGSILSMIVAATPIITIIFSTFVGLVSISIPPLCIIIIPIAAAIGIITGAGIGNYYHVKHTEKSSNSWKKVVKDIDNGKYSIKYNQYMLQNPYFGQKYYKTTKLIALIVINPLLTPFYIKDHLGL